MSPDPQTGASPFRIPDLEQQFPVAVSESPVENLQSMPWWIVVCRNGQAALDQLRLDIGSELDVMSLQYASASVSLNEHQIAISALRIPPTAPLGGAPADILNQYLERLSRAAGGTLQITDQTIVDLGNASANKITAADGSVAYTNPINRTLFLIGDVTEAEAESIFVAIAAMVSEPPPAFEIPLAVEQQFCSLEQGRGDFSLWLTDLQTAAANADWEAAQVPAVELANWSASWRSLVGEPLASFAETSALAAQLAAALDELDFQLNDILSFSPVMMRPPPTQEAVAHAIDAMVEAIDATGGLIEETADLACGVGVV